MQWFLSSFFPRTFFHLSFFCVSIDQLVSSFDYLSCLFGQTLGVLLNLYCLRQGCFWSAIFYLFYFGGPSFSCQPSIKNIPKFISLKVVNKCETSEGSWLKALNQNQTLADLTPRLGGTDDMHRLLLGFSLGSTLVNYLFFILIFWANVVLIECVY